MSSYPPATNPWATMLDRDRCGDVDVIGGRCQLLGGHTGAHILQRAGQRIMWPDGAVPAARPLWSVTFPRDET